MLFISLERSILTTSSLYPKSIAPHLFLIYLKEMHYMIWYIGLISSGWKKYTVCKSSYMMARIFLWSENEMEMLSFPKNLGDVVLE